MSQGHNSASCSFVSSPLTREYLEDLALQLAIVKAKSQNTKVQVWLRSRRVIEDCKDWGW